MSGKPIVDNLSSQGLIKENNARREISIRKQVLYYYLS